MPLPQSDPRYPDVVDIWTSYRDLTRFLESTRLALTRERALWNGVEFHSPEDVVLQAEGVGGPTSTYRVKVADHLGALADDEVLAGLVLLKTASLCEALFRLLLAVDELSGGVETWGTRGLTVGGRQWADAMGGEAGAVDVYVHRNAVAHGSTTWTTTMSDRLKRAGGVPPALGTPVTVASQLETFRARLRSLMRLTGLTIG